MAAAIREAATAAHATDRANRSQKLRKAGLHRHVRIGRVSRQCHSGVTWRRAFGNASVHRNQDATRPKAGSMPRSSREAQRAPGRDGPEAVSQPATPQHSGVTTGALLPARPRLLTALLAPRQPNRTVRISRSSSNAKANGPCLHSQWKGVGSQNTHALRHLNSKIEVHKALCWGTPFVASLVPARQVRVWARRTMPMRLSTVLREEPSLPVWSQRGGKRRSPA